MKSSVRALLLAALLCVIGLQAVAAIDRSDAVTSCVKACNTLDGRRWASMGRSNTPCAHEVTNWPRPESFRACRDGHTSGAVLACQMGCHGIACNEISTRWRRVAQTQDQVCGPWAGALPRPKMRYKCEEAFEHGFAPGCKHGSAIMAKFDKLEQAERERELAEQQGEGGGDVPEVVEKDAVPSEDAKADEPAAQPRVVQEKAEEPAAQQAVEGEVDADKAAPPEGNVVDDAEASFK